MVDFVFNIHSWSTGDLKDIYENLNRKLQPVIPDNQLAGRFNTKASGGGTRLTQCFTKFVQVSDQFTTNVEYKINHVSKILKLEKETLKSVSEDCASF